MSIETAIGVGVTRKRRVSFTGVSRSVQVSGNDVANNARQRAKKNRHREEEALQETAPVIPIDRDRDRVRSLNNRCARTGVPFLRRH